MKKLSDEERQRRAVEAEHRSARWLSKGNEAQERGNRVRAEACFEAATHWLTKANELRGLA